MNPTEYAAADAHAVAFEADFGTDWDEREGYGERYLSERDFDLADPESDAPSVNDWDAFLEMSWVDPAERGW